MPRNIEGVEIFASGEWNGDKYSCDDLDEMVRAFEATNKTFRPPLKLGHTDNQTLLQQDGLPAAGWVGRIYRQGEKLLADFIDIPQKIYDLLTKGAYKHVSSEVYWNADIGGETYGRMLAGVALLGADMPAVTTLNDIIAMYAGKFEAKKIYAGLKNQPTIKVYTFGKEDTEVENTEQKNEELDLAKAKIADLETKVENFSKNFVAATELESARAKIAELEARNRAAELDGQVNSLLAKHSISPAMKDHVRALLDENKKEYAFGDKKLTRVEVIESALSLHAEMLKLNTKEKTIEGKEIKQGPDALVQEMNQKMADGKLSAKQAYKAVAEKVKG